MFQLIQISVKNNIKTNFDHVNPLKCGDKFHAGSSSNIVRFIYTLIYVNDHKITVKSV